MSFPLISIRRICLILTGFSFWVVPSWCAQIDYANIDISASSYGWEIQRRMETREAKVSRTQVFPREAEFLDPEDGRIKSNGYDSLWLETYQPGIKFEHLKWKSEEQGSSIQARPELNLSCLFTNDSIGTRFLTGFGLTLYGKVVNSLSFYSHGAVFTEATERPQFSHQFNPEYGEAYSVDKGTGDSLLANRTYNRNEYYLKYRFKPITIRAGRDWIHTGPGYFSSLTSSRETPPYPFAETRVDFAPWLFMDDFILRMTDTDHSILKYQHIHRFDFKLMPGLNLGYQDAVIYQNRDVDYRYLLPLVPLTFTEQNSGGLDNASMQFDFKYHPVQNLSLWGEFFIDDLLNPISFLDGWWENRWATLSGFQVISPWKAFDADLVVEYTHVEPWTYIGRSPQTGFKHFNVPSASRLGPDSRSLDAQIAWRPTRRNALIFAYFFGEKGTGAGSSLSQPHVDSVDGLRKSFLSNPNRTQALTIQSRMQFSWFVSAVVRARYSFEEAKFADFGATMGWTW